MHLAAAQLLRGDHLAGGRADQRRAAEEDRALAADDDGLVAHGRHVGAARGARAQHGGDLRDAAGRHGGLVVEDPAEVLAVREDLVLAGQEGAAGVHQVQARQPVLQGDLLGAQVLLDRDRVVGAALDGGVVGHDHAFPPGHPADAGDDPGAGRLAAVHARRPPARTAPGTGTPGRAARRPGPGAAACRGPRAARGPAPGRPGPRRRAARAGPRRARRSPRRCAGTPGCPGRPGWPAGAYPPSPTG